MKHRMGFGSIMPGDVVRHNGRLGEVMCRDVGALRVLPLEGYTRYPVWIAGARWYYDRGELTVVERREHE